MVLSSFQCRGVLLLLHIVGFGLVWFLFYCPSTRFRSFRARSVNLSALFLGKPPRQFTSISAHSFTSNWQLLFLNQRMRENGRRNVFMIRLPRKNVPDLGIELGATCMPREHASDRATAPGAYSRARACCACTSSGMGGLYFLYFSSVFHF